ncbi:MAG: caspase family protein [Saprospiraceae bacterium]|nr:caspase family protein [Saprospiraceae bacterium]
MKEFPNIENYLPKDSLDYQRLLNFQEKARSNGYEKGHLWMAGLAAFPVFLTPDLLYKLWLNFRHISYQNGQSLDIDRMAVSDLLLSTLAEEIAVEVFRIRPQIRTALLALLEDWSLSLKGGDDFVKRLADFTLRYVRSYQMEGESVTTAIREAQEWNALAYFNPNAAALELKKALSQAVESNAKQKVLRISLMLSEMDEQFTQLGQQEQQEQFRTLVNYGQGMQSLIRGQKEEAIKAFKNIERQTIASEDITTTGKRVQLPIPKEIYQAIAVEEASASTIEPVRIFALLIGITEYEKVESNPYPSGVEKDLSFWQDFFSERVEEKVQINTLWNGAATKAAVLEALKLECRKATAGSQLFFFFSGLGENKAHGREETTILLHDYQPDSNLGTLLESEFREQVVAFLPEGAGFTLVLDTSSGGKNWINTNKPGRYIYNATDIDQGAQASPEGGLLTRAFRQALVDVNGAYFTHLGLMKHLRSLMPSLSNGTEQTATWFGPRDEQESTFLNLAVPANLRLRELMVDTGLARPLTAIDVPAVLEKFRMDYSIGDHLSVERALSIWASTSNKSFKVFISQSNSSFALRTYVEDLLFNKNIPNQIFTHDLQREVELEMQKARVSVELDWSVQVVEADFIILQIDEDWIKEPKTKEIVALLELRLMESQVPYALIYADICDWSAHPVSRLGAVWPSDSIAKVYAKKEEQEFIVDLTEHLAPTIDYIACFLGKPDTELAIQRFQGQLLERLVDGLGRYHPKEAAQLSSGQQEVDERLAFVQAHYPAPIGQALTYLLAPKANSELLRASYEAWLMIVHTLNTFLLALLRQLIKRDKGDLQQQLTDLDFIENLAVQDWFSNSAATAQFLDILQRSELLSGILEELGLVPEAWQQLISKDLPHPVREEVALGTAGDERSRQIQGTLSSNYGHLIQWFDRLEILIDVKWTNICQLFSSENYTPVLFNEQALNPFQEGNNFYRLSHQVDAGSALHFNTLGRTQQVVAENEEPSAAVWGSFQELLEVFGVGKPAPAHPAQAHALLVGINNYRDPLPSLRAPENDILQFKAYLDQQPLPAQSEMLSGAVTKANIIETLRTIVEKAEPGDAVVFYFSGLGQKEESPRLNDTIPAILTFDQQRIPIDEIVYLLCQDKEKALQPIIILDMGVNANISKENNAAGLLPKGIDAVGTARDWSNYQFGNQILSMEAWGAFMQEASFVLMVGCDYDNETALEDESGSFFTRNLIEVLSRSRHFLPYPVLQERLTDVLSHQVPQTPDIRVEGPSQSLSSPNFLGQPSIDFQPMYGRVEWNRRLQKWTIDMGSTLGLNKQQIVHICTSEYQGNALARISYVYDDFSTLAFGDQLPNRSESYLGFVDEFLQTEPLKLAIKGYEEEINRTHMMELGGAFPGVEFGEENEVDFILHADDKALSIRPSQISDGYIYQTTELQLKSPFDGFAELIRKMGQAKALRSLVTTDITQDPFVEDLNIELRQIDEDGQVELINPAKSSSTRDHYYQVNFDQLKRFEIQVKNQTKGLRFIAVLLVRNDLGISTLVYNDVIKPVKPGETIRSRRWRAVLPIAQEGAGKPHFQHTVKIIVSDQGFTPAYWLQSGLSIPNQEEGPNQFAADATLSLHDNLWSISTIRIDSGYETSRNISPDKLKQLLSQGKIKELLDTLFPLIPEETDLFQRLVSTGSRFTEVQRVKIKRLADEAPISIQEKRIEQALLEIISSKELPSFLANQAEAEEEVALSASKAWYQVLLTQGITPALQSLPNFPNEDRSREEIRTQIQEAAAKNSMNFTGLRITFEEYMVAYSRHLVQLNNWVSSIEPETWASPNDSSAEEPQEELSIERLQKLKLEIQEQVALGNFVEALEELRGHFPTHPLTQELLLLQANLSHIDEDLNMSLISSEQAQFYHNRTAESILNFLDQPALLPPPTTQVDWTREQQTLLLSPFLQGDLDQSTANLLALLDEQKEFQQEAIILRSKFLQLQSDRRSGNFSEEDYRKVWNEIANSFLDFVRELPSDINSKPAPTPEAESKYDSYQLPTDLTLLLDRRKQFEEFVSKISDSKASLEVFFLPAPPKSEPQHFLKRLAWHMKPNENEDTIIWDPIFVKSSTPLHRLSSQFEKVWEERRNFRTTKDPERLLVSIHFDADWFENKEDLAAWLASEGSKRIEEIQVKQLIAAIILEVPEANSRSAIGRLLRGDPLQRQLDWLEKLVEEYDNAAILTTLNKVSLDDIDNWLQTLADGKLLQGRGFDINSLKDSLSVGKTLQVIELLQNEPSLTEEDRSRVAIIQSKIKETERSKNLGILTVEDIQIREAQALRDLLSLISELETRKEFDLTVKLRDEILDQLSSSLGRSPEGYHMEDVLKAVNRLQSLPILNKIERNVASLDLEDESVADDASAWDQARYENTVKSYNSYLSQYPDGLNSEKARLLLKRLESIRLTHQATPLPSISNTPKERELSHKIEIKVQAETEDIQSITSVTYFLHKSFKRREITVSSAETNFALKLDVWGIFTIRATVLFKDGTQIKLERELDF